MPKMFEVAAYVVFHHRKQAIDIDVALHKLEMAQNSWQNMGVAGRSALLAEHPGITESSSANHDSITTTFCEFFFGIIITGYIAVADNGYGYRFFD